MPLERGEAGEVAHDNGMKCEVCRLCRLPSVDGSRLGVPSFTSGRYSQTHRRHSHSASARPGRVALEPSATCGSRVNPVFNSSRSSSGKHTRDFTRLCVIHTLRGDCQTFDALPCNSKHSHQHNVYGCVYIIPSPLWKRTDALP